MSIIDEIGEARVSFIEANGYDPTRVYIGYTEERHIKVWLKSINDTSKGIMLIDGMTVFIVNESTHLYAC